VYFCIATPRPSQQRPNQPPGAAPPLLDALPKPQTACNVAYEGVVHGEIPADGAQDTAAAEVEAEAYSGAVMRFARGVAAAAAPESAADADEEAFLTFGAAPAADSSTTTASLDDLFVRRKPGGRRTEAHEPRGEMSVKSAGNARGTGGSAESGGPWAASRASASQSNSGGLPGADANSPERLPPSRGLHEPLVRQHSPSTSSSSQPPPDSALQPPHGAHQTPPADSVAAPASAVTLVSSPGPAEEARQQRLADQRRRLQDGARDYKRKHTRNGP